MLSEITYVKHIDGDLRRRWFADEEFDLIVWLGDDDAIAGFQLCYDKSKDQRAFTWRSPNASRHDRVDDGENDPGRYKSTPILVPDGAFDAARVSEAFRRSSTDIDDEIAELVLKQLRSWRGPKPEIRRPRYWG
jgi:hypothetical protein